MNHVQSHTADLVRPHERWSLEKVTVMKKTNTGVVPSSDGQSMSNGVFIDFLESLFDQH